MIWRVSKTDLFAGAVMTDVANRLLGVKPTKFLPKHTNGLQNEFRCFTNYDSILLDQNDWQIYVTALIWFVCVRVCVRVCAFNY